MPADPPGGNVWNSARGIRLWLKASPPTEGDGTACFDDLALVAWERAQAASELRLQTPHHSDFVRVEGTPGKTVKVSLTVRRHLAPWE